MLVRGAKLFKEDLIFFLYMSHLLKGGNVGQNIKKNQFLPPRDTMCVQITTGFKAEVCS